MRPAPAPCGVAAALGCAALMLLPLALADPIETIEQPTRVPGFTFLSLGNGIEPGSSGTYGFALKNRYNASMVNVSLTIEVYRWATVEAERNLSEIASPPVFEASGTSSLSLEFPSIEANASVDVAAPVRAPSSSPEGVYFTRHLIAFDYPNFTVPPNATARTAHFVMKSRGYFTAEEFASINYSALNASLSALGVAGIVPDSSFSVRRPAPLWPLALLVAATALTGGLSTALYLTEAYPGRFPRMKEALLRLSGKAAVYRALAREEVRAALSRGRR